MIARRTFLASLFGAGVGARVAAGSASAGEPAAVRLDVIGDGVIGAGPSARGRIHLEALGDPHLDPASLVITYSPDDGDDVARWRTADLTMRPGRAVTITANGDTLFRGHVITVIEHVHDRVCSVEAHCFGVEGLRPYYGRRGRSPLDVLDAANHANVKLDALDRAAFGRR